MTEDVGVIQHQTESWFGLSLERILVFNEKFQSHTIYSPKFDFFHLVPTLPQTDAD